MVVLQTFNGILNIKNNVHESYKNTTHKKKKMNCSEWIFDSDVWLTVHRNSVWIRKTDFFISLLIAAQHVSGNHVPIIRS